MSVRLRVLLFVVLLLAGAASAAPPPIHAYYFTAPRCPNCTKATNLLAGLTEHDPQIKLHLLDVYEPAQYETAEALLTVAGIPARFLPLGPALLVGDTYVDRGRFTPQAAGAALQQYRTTGAPDLTTRALRLRGHARQSLPQELRRWGLLPFLVAGLLDGFNPCAFATLVFFLSYLGMMGMRGGSLLGVGLAFAAGVFAAYFAFGLGLLHALWALDGFPLVRWGLYWAMAVLCFVFAGLSWRDYRHLQRGDFSAVTLQLPSSLKRSTHKVIREGLRRRQLYPAGFLIGGAVAALELACTGQVYIPALLYLMSLPETRGSGMLYLAIYDLMFTVPLLLLLALVVKGDSLPRLRRMAEQQAGQTKLYLALFFVLCAVFFLTRAAGL